MKLTENFNSEEFYCGCSCSEISSATTQMDPLLIHKLQHARNLYGKPMRITSGYRCEAHNKAVGGVPNSYHCQGKAVHILIGGQDDRKRLIRALREAGFKRIGVYPSKGFVHVDVGESPSPVTWEG